MASTTQLRKIKLEATALAETNEELLEDVRRAEDRALDMSDQLQRLKEAVASAGDVPDVADKEVQCSMRGQGNRMGIFAGGATGDSRVQQPPAEFKFIPRDRKINWKLLQRANIRRIEANTDTATLSALMEDIALGDVESASVFNITEGNLIKLFQLAQLMLQFVSHERQVLEYQYDNFLENRERVLQLLERADIASLDDLRDGAYGLGRKFTGLAGLELEDMFGQVRTEEQSLARMVLAGAVEETKRRYENDVEDEQLLGEDGASD